MTEKKKRTLRMREVRKATGLPLPVAAELAKMAEWKWLQKPQLHKYMMIEDLNYCEVCRTKHTAGFAVGKKGIFQLW